MRFPFAVCVLAAALITGVFAQKAESSKSKSGNQNASEQQSSSKSSEKKTEASQPAEEKAPEPAKTAEPGDKEEHFDVSEVPPVVTHHQITVDGKPLKYTATAGRLPIKRADGKIEAEMFFVAYTLDGQDAGRRPLTFAFNGGPGSASIWLHMGALGPKRVVLQPNGFMPAAPYRNIDNPYTPLDKTDLVLVDAIGTGFSRAATSELAKKFWGVKGDIQSFGEFIRMYITRYERWSSPLFLLGESYGTTRSAGVAGYLANQGISFNGIVLLSTVIDFQSLVFTKTNDEPYILILPSYTMVAAYHKKLAPELTQDLAKTRQEVEHWATTEYAQALAKGDAISPAERESVIAAMSRYTGLTKDLIDQANLRVDVPKFTHNLLLDQKVRVGRLDGRFTGPDPDGLLDTPFYDPTASSLVPPYTSVFNNYVRSELGYKSDMPYTVFAFQDRAAFSKWDWGSAIDGFPDTATALREAITKNKYLKVLVMQGDYDLATPFYAAEYSMDHLNLSPEYRKNLSFATYGAGHMVYVDTESLAKFKHDLVTFIDQTLPGGQ
jgi:carboxypeptidase C (cathepsin A)